MNELLIVAIAAMIFVGLLYWYVRTHPLYTEDDCPDISFPDDVWEDVPEEPEEVEPEKERGKSEPKGKALGHEKMPPGQEKKEDEDMPIRKVKGGYKWGGHGKVYKSRKGAEKQAAAAHASGYKSDGSKSHSRKGKAKAPKKKGK